MGLSSAQYTNLFECIGEYVQRINDFQTIISDLETDRSQIETELEANSVPIGFYGDNTAIFDGYKSNVVSWINQLVSKVSQLMENDDFVLDNFVTTGGWEGILPEIIKDMTDTSQHIKQSVVTVGSVSSTLTNANSSILLVDKKLDGYNIPISGGIATRHQSGIDSELGPTSETFRVTAIEDSDETGVTDGKENFIIHGDEGSTGYHHGDTGSNSGPTISTLHAESSNYGLGNGDFETWTDSTTPGSWTQVSGFDPVDRTVDAYKGDYAMACVGNGSKTWRIEQAVTTSRLDRYRRYVLACFVKGKASISAGALTIKFTGTGYTASSSEKIEMNAAALAAQTAYGVEYFYITMPSAIPTDMKLQVDLAGGLTSGKTVLIDHIQFGPVEYFGGVNFALVDGSGKTTIRDTHSSAISNNDAGVFQTFFRKGLNVQLPSDSSPSIADSLASD
tara:strand:+ start:28451 stop:29797 length:1347 start_codon:yes stop_codon:yes gene_type:complete